MKTPPVQRKEDKKNDPIQQKKEEAVQMKEMSPPPFSLDAGPAQLKSAEEDEEAVQAKMAPAQMKSEEEEEKA